MDQLLDMLSKASISRDEEKDYKSIKIPQFSDGTEWDAVVFELEVNLEKYWKHQNDLDIVDYLNGISMYCDQKFIDKADEIIYHAIVTAAKRDSFARKQIMASRHDDAVPQVKRNEGLKLFNLFQDIFTNKSKSKANLPNALLSFNQMKMTTKELAKDYISRVDSAVSDLALLNEKVSINSWIFILANGLRPEFAVTRKGVLFMEQGYGSIKEVKDKILQEETINGIGKPEKLKTQNDSKDSETAYAAIEGKCYHCGRKGHKKEDCRDLKKETAKEGSKKKMNQYWCDICYMAGHSTDYCFKNPSNKGKGKGGKGKSSKGKGKGKGGKGKTNKGGRGKGKGNFPANYVSEDWSMYSYTKENDRSTETNWDLKEEEPSSSDWFDYQLSVFETDIPQENASLFTPIFLKNDVSAPNFLLVLKENDVTAWTQNNVWTEQDFKSCTRGDQPTLAANGGPECGFLLNEFNKQSAQISRQLNIKIHELEERKANGEKGLWMFLDSGASRSVIQENSPIREHLINVSETNGSCNVGNGAKLKYLQKGLITKNNEVTVVKGLKYDLYAAVAAAKRGVSCVLDYSTNGKNQSYLLCKKTGTITPLIERKQGILEVPIHLYIKDKESGLKLTENELQENSESAKLSSAEIAKFWYGMDQCRFDPITRTNNSDEISLFMHDIINSLGQKQKDFLIHARLAHLPRKAILQLLKNGAKGLPYKGKFKELCRPCMESRQRAENHGKELTRHPNGKIGEHFHSDLAIVNIADFNGFKYVLTVVDEISDEVIITLLKKKTAEEVLAACKNSYKIITARCKSQLKSWQFDRGSEFLNESFEEWIVKELGASQLFSNIEHPWENGRAERSFATLFQKARAMLIYADLPNAIWGKAIVHAAYLKNRSPSTRLNFKSPLQFRTGEAQDFTRLRVFGCPAQIFVKSKDRESNKISSRSEKGTLIGMSTVGNGYLFRIQRTKCIVEVDSKDAKFNETFSNCMDKKGREIKGGKVLDPDLFNESETAHEIMKGMASWKENGPSKFANSNRFNTLKEDNNNDDNDETESNNESESSKDNDETESNNESESSKDNTETESNNEYDEPESRKGKDENNSENENSDNDGEKLQKTKRHQNRPMKTSTIKPKKKSKSKLSREMKKILPSKGFQSDQSSSSKRKTLPPKKFEPTFEPTYKRNDTTLMIENEEDDLTNLNPVDQTFDQLLSCLEQNVKRESGRLNDPEEELMKNLQDIGRPDPKSQKEINKMPAQTRKRYNDATTREYEGMKSKKVMEFVRITDIPKNAKIYICIVNWVTKYVLGQYQKTKCRICFGGHHYVKTFTDCFAPTVSFCSVLIMLCLSAMFGWHIGSLDYAQAYLNANIDEECFLRAPEFIREFDTDGTEFVWRLKKVIYGHPKGSRLWAECLNNKLKELGFTQFATDQCVYGKWINWNLRCLKNTSYFVFVLIHSDDLIIISNMKDKMMQEKEILLKAFEGVDQGTLKSFCGVEIDISESKISLSMNYYWRKVLKKFGIAENDKEERPLKLKINKNDCPNVPDEKIKKTYLQIIGSIIFGFTHCRLDLAFPVGMLTRVMHAPNEHHLKQLKDLLKYINATIDWKLNFFRDPTVYYGMNFTFYGHCDSSHADDESSSRSTGGHFFFLRRGQGCINSKSGQTPDVALSSTEAETIWACNAATQGAFIKQFLDELKIFRQISFELMEDSQPAINAQRKNVSQSRFRHIKIKYHYIRQLISEGWCKLVKISTKEQVADIATKILPTDTVKYFSNIVLGTVDQSLYVFDTDLNIPFNDWGVVSVPDFMYA
jgi:transposase InsO family protein